jgi:hypothetical protein
MCVCVCVCQTIPGKYNGNISTELKLKYNVLTWSNTSLLPVNFIIVLGSEAPGNFARIYCFKNDLYKDKFYSVVYILTFQ